MRRRGRIVGVTVLLVVGGCSCKSCGCCISVPSVLGGEEVGSQIDCNTSNIECLGSGKDATKVFCNCSCSSNAPINKKTVNFTTGACLPPELNVKLAAQDATLQQRLADMSPETFAAGLQTFCAGPVKSWVEAAMDQYVRVQSSDFEQTCSCEAEGFNQGGAPDSTTAVDDVCSQPCVAAPCPDCIPELREEDAVDFVGPKCTPLGGQAVTTCNQIPNPVTGQLSDPVCTSSPRLSGVLAHLLGGESVVDIDPTASSATLAVDFDDDLGFHHHDSDTTTLLGRVLLVELDRTTPAFGLDLHLAGTDAEFTFSFVEDFTVHLRHMTVDGETGFEALTVDGAGRGTIPVGALTLRAEATVDHRQVLARVTNEVEVPFVVDWANKSFSIPRMDFDAGNGLTGNLSVTGPIVNQPPLANAGASLDVECESPQGKMVTLDGSASSDPDGAFDLSWFSGPVSLTGAGPVDFGPTISVLAPFQPPLEKSLYSLVAWDDHGQSSTSGMTVTVRDTTAPTLEQPADVNATLCDPSTEPTRLPIPAASDACSTSVAVTGTVIESNGKSVSIALDDGAAVLPAGTHVIEWRAEDASGLVTTKRQTVGVRPAFYASHWLRIGNQSKLTTGSGTGAALANSGTPSGELVTDIGEQARTGSILSVPPVVVKNAAVVSGFLQSQSTVTLGQAVMVSGTVSSNTSVHLAPPPDFSGLSFPTSTDGSRDVGRGQDLALAPGSYDTVSVRSGGTLRLAGGACFVRRFELDAGSNLAVDATTELNVQDDLTYRGSVTSSASAVFELRFWGSRDITLETRFSGRLLAPSATVTLGEGTSLAYGGEFFAKDLVTRPGVVVTCNVTTPLSRAE